MNLFSVQRTLICIFFMAYECANAPNPPSMYQPAFATLCTKDADEEVKDRKASDLVESLIKQLRKGNTAQIEEKIAVPWLDNENKIIQDQTELTKLWRTRLNKVDLGNYPKEIQNAAAFRTMSGEIKDEKDRKMLEQVLGDDGRIVLAIDKEAGKMRYFLVTFRNGQPRLAGGPFRLTYLLLPNRIPEEARAALEKATQFELLSIEPNRPEGKETQDGFYGFTVLGKTAVRDEKTRKRLVGELFKAAEENEGMAAMCFKPRHGIRVVHNNKTIDFVICFECQQVYVMGIGDRKQFLVGGTPSQSFNEVLQAAKVQLPKQAK